MLPLHYQAMLLYIVPITVFIYNFGDYVFVRAHTLNIASYINFFKKFLMHFCIDCFINVVPRETNTFMRVYLRCIVGMSDLALTQT